MLGFSSAEGTTCESMGCKSHVSETACLKVPVGMTGVQIQVCVNVECNAKKKLQPRKGRPWSLLKRYRLLILLAEFVLKANPDFLKGEDTETDFDF